MKTLYFDSPVVRSLVKSPEAWNSLYDPFIKTFGQKFRIIKSYYLFFEYIGFTKKNLKIPTELKKPMFDHREKLARVNLAIPATISSEAINLIDENLNQTIRAISAHVETHMYALQTTLEKLVAEREKRIFSFKGSRELHQFLFGDMIAHMRIDFEGFVKYATRYLSWDIFCGINPIGLSLNLVRERQLGFWLQLWEEGIELPIGKIIDDQVSYYNMQQFRSHFKEFEDMVDAEMHTYLIMGRQVDKALHSIYALAYPPNDIQAFGKRNELVLGTIKNIEKSLQEILAKCSGKLYTLDPKTHNIQIVYEPIFKIES